MRDGVLYITRTIQRDVTLVGIHIFPILIVVQAVDKVDSFFVLI